MAAVSFFSVSRLRRSSSGIPSFTESTSWVAILAASLVLTGPALAVLVAGQFINPNNTTLALALVPVVIAIVVSVSGEAEHSEFTGLLWPGLAGVAGLLLLVPQPSFGDIRPWLGMVAMPVIVGVGAGVWSARTRQSREGLSEGGRLRLASSLLAAAMIFAGLAVLHWRAGGELAFSLSAAALDGLTAALTLLVLRRFRAVRWSAQFLLIPLVGLLEGVVLLRPFLDWRSYLAFGLMGVSGLYQGRAHTPDDAMGTSGETATRVPEA